MQPEIVIELNQVAVITVLLIAFAFLFNVHPFKKNKRLVIGDLAVAPAKNLFAELWTAGDYFMYLNALLKVSNTPDELRQAMVYVKNYKEKTFRVPISAKDRSHYYDRLIDTYTKKELEFDCTKLELCKN